MKPQAREGLFRSTLRPLLLLSAALLVLGSCGTPPTEEEDAALEAPVVQDTPMDQDDVQSALDETGGELVDQWGSEVVVEDSVWEADPAGDDWDVAGDDWDAAGDDDEWVADETGGDVDTAAGEPADDVVVAETVTEAVTLGENVWGSSDEPVAVVTETVAAPATGFAGATQDEVSQLVQEARQHTAVLEQRVQLLVDSFLDEGLALMERGDLAGAHSQFASAYELDPGNPVVRDLYNRTGLLMGEKGASLGAVTASARDMAQARREQRGVLVSHNVELGRKALAAGDPELALQHFEDSLALLRWNPDLTGTSTTAAEVAAMVAAARYEIEQLDERRESVLAQRAAEARRDFDFAEENRRALRIEGLLRSADELFLRDDFDAAVENLDEVLRLDPQNEQANSLRRVATRASFDASARSIRLAYRREWVRTFDDLTRDTLIPNDLITFPSPAEWDAIVNRGHKSFGDFSQARPEGDKAVADRLDEVRIPVDFQDSTLAEVLANLGQVTGVNFIMSPAVIDEEANLPNYSMLDRNPQPVSRVLKLILEDQSVPQLTYTIQNGVARIITQEESVGDYHLEMYDIRDLTFTPVDYASEDFNLLPSGTDAESFTEGVEQEEPLPLISEDSLLSLIQDNIAPATWTDDPQRTISQMPGTLIIKTTPDVHEQIRQLLADLRLNTGTLINIETRFIEVEDSFLEDIGVDLRGLSAAEGTSLEDFGQANAGGVGTPSNPAGIGTGIDPGVYYPGNNGDLKGRTENLFDTMLGESSVLTGSGGLSLDALFLDDTNVNAVLRAVTKYQNSNIVNAPNLTIRSGQRGTISSLTNRTYLRDFEPEIAQSAVIAQPELGVVKSGITLDVRAVSSDDRRFITMELRPTVATLVPGANGADLPEELVSLGTPNANNVTIQLPELQIQRVRTTATIPDGATLLLGGLKRSAEQDFKSEVPLLADIPMLSFFFSREGEYVSQRKLLILLTATIIAPEEHEPATGFLR